MLNVADTKKAACGFTPPSGEFTKSFRFVTYKGKQIAVVDVAHTVPEESVQILREATRQIAKLPPGSALVLTDASHAVYDKASAAALKETARSNTPFVKASAAVGVEGLLGILVPVVTRLTGRQYRMCKTRTEAMEWLITQ